MDFTREVGLWINNDEGLYGYITRAAQNNIENSSDRDEAVDGLALDIEDFLRGHLLGGSGLGASLIEGALAEVDFTEIAEDFIDDDAFAEDDEEDAEDDEEEEAEDQ